MMRRYVRGFTNLFSTMLILMLSGAMAYTMQLGARKMPVRQYFPDHQTNAVWDWRDPRTRTEKDLRELKDYLYLHQVDTVYADITVYNDISRQADAASAVAELEAALERTVRILGERGIRVFGMTGHADWSKPSHRHIPANIQTFVHQYNARHPHARLAGMQFDIESYNQAGFAEASMTEKSLVLLELLDTVDELAGKHIAHIQQSKHADFEMGFAVPYWFDNQNGNIPSVTWKGRTGPVIYHMMDRLNQLPRSNVVVMAYRNAALGSDGTIFHARTEIEYAHSKAPNVDVLVGQELGDFEPSKITFYGKTPAELSSEAQTIAEEFKDLTSYGGIALNDLDSLRQLETNE